MSRPDDDDDDVPRERLILVNVIEARAPPPPLPLGKKNVVVVVIAKKVVARFFSSSRLLPRVTLVSRFSVCLSLLSRRKRKKEFFFVEKVPSSSLFFCGAECTKRKKKDMRPYTYSKGADQDTHKDTQRYTAEYSLSEYPEYLRDSSHVLIASLLNIPLTQNLLIFHLFFSGALLLRC